MLLLKLICETNWTMAPLSGSLSIRRRVQASMPQPSHQEECTSVTSAYIDNVSIVLGTLNARRRQGPDGGTSDNRACQTPVHCPGLLLPDCSVLLRLQPLPLSCTPRTQPLLILSQNSVIIRAAGLCLFVQ